LREILLRLHRERTPQMRATLETHAREIARHMRRFLGRHGRSNT
jgi:hypothetical protein